jgi:hypothetical protein
MRVEDGPPLSVDSQLCGLLQLQVLLLDGDVWNAITVGGSRELLDGGRGCAERRRELHISYVLRSNCVLAVWSTVCGFDAVLVFPHLSNDSRDYHSGIL